jgi:hypothetical protein
MHFCKHKKLSNFKTKLCFKEREACGETERIDISSSRVPAKAWTPAKAGKSTTAKTPEQK